MARTLPFFPKPLPAKASLRIRRRVLRIANNLQVLAGLDAAAVEHIDHLAASLRERAELGARDPLLKRAT